MANQNSDARNEPSREEKRRLKAQAVRALLALTPTEAPEDYQEWERRYLDEGARDHG